MFLPIVLIIFVISPIIYIRISPLKIARIGHLSAEVENFLCEKKFKKKTNILDFFFNRKNEKVCNKFYYQFIKKKITIIPRIIGINLFQLIQYIRRKFNITKLFYYQFDDNSNPKYFKINNQQLRISEKEFLNARYLVEKFFGIKKGDKYVCIIVRDKAYLKKNSYNQSWSYHDYRNSNIYSYLPACDYLTKEGYKVIRMGNVVEKKLLTKNKNIIDYGGSKYISDLLDIYLMSNCEFVISSGTGLDAIAKICRKPMILANFVPLGAFNYSANLTYLIFKKYYNVKINRLMTLSEIFLNGSAYYFTSNDFRKNKIKLIDNTQDEILGVVKDFIKNQKQRKKITRLNKNFWKLYYKFRMNANNDTYRTSYRLNFTIGESFLRKYKTIIK